MSLVIANAAAKDAVHPGWTTTRHSGPPSRFASQGPPDPRRRDRNALPVAERPPGSSRQDDTYQGDHIVRGTEEGRNDGVTTQRTADELLALIPEKDLLKNFVTVDATGIVGGSGLESVDFMGSEGGTESVAVAVGLAAPMVGAATKVCNKFSLENVIACAANKAGVKEGAKTAVVKSL